MHGWNTPPLVVACQQLTNPPNRSIGRMHVMIPYPEQGDGALPVVEFAESLAERFGLRVQCALRDNHVMVTFERPTSD